MTVVTTQEFNTNQDMYFDLAIKEDVYIKRGNNNFIVSASNINDLDEYDEILEPDEDFYRAISCEEFKKRVIEIVKKVHLKYSKK